MNNQELHPLQFLIKEIKSEFGAHCKIYGEGVRSLNTNQASNYITVDNSEQCSVDDNYLQTIFYVRETADVENISGMGKNLRMLRTVTFRLIANTESVIDEYRLINIINSIPKLEYTSTSFDQDAIAQNYFGLNERHTDTAFFAIGFTMLETITCKLNNCR
jgi:hypothetical protein